MLTAPPPPKKEKKLRFDFSEGCSQKNYLAFKGKGLFFFPTYRLGCKTSHSMRGKKTHIVSESPLMPNRQTHVGCGGEE